VVLQDGLKDNNSIAGIIFRRTFFFSFFFIEQMLDGVELLVLGLTSRWQVEFGDFTLLNGVQWNFNVVAKSSLNVEERFISSASRSLVWITVIHFENFLNVATLIQVLQSLDHILHRADVDVGQRLK